MEKNIQLQLLVSVLSIFIFFKLINKLLKPKKSSSNLPPGPWKLPIIGNIHNLMGSVPHRALQNLASKHGPVIHLQLGELPVVVVSSAETAKQVLKTHDLNFASRPRILAAEIISYGCTSITFGPYGDYWRQLRKICTLELLSPKRVQSFKPIREKVYLDLVKWIASKEGSVINLTEKLYTSTLAVISTAALGKKTMEQEMLLLALKEAIDLGSGFNIADLYPSIKFLNFVSGLRPRLEKLHKTADKILEGIVQEHKHKHKIALKIDDDDDEKEKKHEDLVDILLKVQEDGLELPLTTDNIKSVIVDVVAAGSETSATVMDWAMSELLRNPRVLKKAQDEVRQAFDTKGFIDESCIQELDYLKSIIKETLRLHAPLPLLLPRKCSNKCEINGYEIPVETKVIINAWAINRDPNYWKDAECFYPERFLESLVDYKGNSFEYIPFGAGRRICPGISFGLANVELPLAIFLYHFDWKLEDGIKHEEMDMSEGFGITARRKMDLCVVPLIKRSFNVK